MDNFKGNLRGPKEFIIKIGIRNTNGEPQHKAEFRLNDRPSLVRELNTLKEKFGAVGFEITGKHKQTLIEQQEKEAEEELDSLSDWREKTKGLREPDKNLQEKMKNAL